MLPTVPIRSVRLLRPHVHEQRAHFADRQRDLEADLADSFGLARRRRVVPKLAEELLEPLDLRVVLVRRIAIQAR